jgi:TM2 domain-containing membrane protein YozV
VASNVVSRFVNDENPVPELGFDLKLEVNETMRDPLLAGFLSFLVPGVGQIYNGRILVGIIWLLLTGVSWIGSAGTLGWIVHLIAAWCAYSYAKDFPVR